MASLKDKQEVFCREYLVDLNATQAAIRAGYSEKTAGVTSHNMLKNPKIAARIAELKADRIARTEITADYVLTGLQTVAERCLQRTPVMEFDYKQKCMVQKQDDQGNDVWEFDSTGANRAFELLGKHVGIFEKDNSQKKPETAPVTDAQLDKLITALKR